jgi:hypothetical protein
MTVAVVAAGLAGAIALAGCTGLEGTISLTVVTAPDSDLRERVVRLRMTSDNPADTVEVERGADGGFALRLDLPAEGQSGSVTVEGFDADGAVIGYGRSLSLPIQAVNGTAAVYLGSPMSLAEAPVALTQARSQMGVAVLPYGAALIGGRASSGAPSAEMEVYNGYTHELQPGLDLPQPRTRPSAVAGVGGAVFVFGGGDEAGLDTAEGWRFDTTAVPAGSYFPLATGAGWERSGAAATAIANNRVAIVGDPALTIDALTNEVAPWAGAPALAGSATTVVFDGVYHALFLGAGPETSVGGYLWTGDGAGGGSFQALDEPALRRTGHGTVVLPDATTLTIGGRLGDVGGILDTAGVIVDPRSGEIARRPALLAVGREDAAIAASGEYVLVAGGRDGAGAVVGDAEIFAADTLERVATLPLVVPRHGAQAFALGNGNIVIVGGVNGTGQPVATIEVFTPAP